MQDMARTRKVVAAAARVLKTSAAPAPAGFLDALEVAGIRVVADRDGALRVWALNDGIDRGELAALVRQYVADRDNAMRLRAVLGFPGAPAVNAAAA